MKVLVDTCVWSEAFRRSRTEESSSNAVHLLELIRDGQVLLLGAVRQEILSGIRDVNQFLRLRNYLRAFPDFPLLAEDYEAAAEVYNKCRSVGVQGSNTDFLICAAASRARAAVFTTDQDFQLFAKHVKVALYSGGTRVK